MIMCKMFSGLFFRDGRLFALPDVTDSHEDLIELSGANDSTDSAFRRPFVRQEFTPPTDGDILDLSRWDLCVDEEDVPNWLSEERSRREWEALVKGMILVQNRKMILRGCWIVAPGVEIGECKNTARIAALLGKLNYVGGSARIGKVYGSASIGRVYGSARIGRVYDSARIGKVYGSASIGGVYDSAIIGGVYDSAVIGGVHGSALVSNDLRSELEKMAAMTRGEWGRIPEAKP